jgi:hypothetical protein
MKKRNPFLVSFLSVITLGAYYSYWLYSTSNTLNKNGFKIASPALPTFLHLLVIVNFGFLLIPLRNDKDLKDSITQVLPLLLVIGIFAIASLSYWFYRFCKAVKPAVTSKSTSLGIFDFPIVLAFHYFLLFFVWAGLAQYKINKLI